MKNCLLHIIQMATFLYGYKDFSILTLPGSCIFLPYLQRKANIVIPTFFSTEKWRLDSLILKWSNMPSFAACKKKTEEPLSFNLF